MERYKKLEELGDGTCGIVYKALDCRTHETVAIKKMKRKFLFWEEYWRLREIRVLRKLSHPNIIKLKEATRENDNVFLVFEHMTMLSMVIGVANDVPLVVLPRQNGFHLMKSCNLYQVMKERKRPFSEDEIRSFMSQLLRGLSHIHKNGYFHRDLKPENLLVTGDVLKIADFGLAREVSSMPPYTEYVSTRWYRAPEVLLQSKSYTPAVDMWAAGAILAELFTLSPIFPGESEIDQLFKICCVLGTPDLTFFPEGTNTSRLFGIMTYEKILPANLSDIIPNASLDAIDLIMRLCSWDPSKRPSADESLQHPFFHVPWISHSYHDPLELKLSNFEAEPNLELKLSDFSAEPKDCFLGLTLGLKPSVANSIRDISRGMDEDAVFCSNLDHMEQSGKYLGLFSNWFLSVFWSLVSPDRNGIHAPVQSSFSLSLSSIQHQASIGVPQTAGFSVPAMQPNLFDGAFLAMSSPFSQGHCR